ncbi:MAG: gamma-glutamyltransferase [Bacteroidetes bacterium]|nr:gamma-glutamyltransferase [Bacteroidota bacterium]
MTNRRRLSITRCFCALLIFAGVCTYTAQTQSLWVDTYTQAAVSSADPVASSIGVEIMAQGGNAIDAAIAVHFALAVTTPRAGNLGGGGFMVIQHSDGSSSALDFREKAPIDAFREMYLDEQGEAISQKSLLGHLASGVPGSVDGMVKAHEAYGHLSWHDLLQPAVELAREGYPLRASQAQSLNAAKDDFSLFEGSALYFIKTDGSAWKAGDVFRQDDLARTLERIQSEGRAGFYAGETATALIQEMDKGGGYIRQQDLDEYESVWRTPIKVAYKDVELVMMPMPSSGGVVIGQLMRMLEMSGASFDSPQSIERTHFLVQLMSRSFADRATYMGDADFGEVPVCDGDGKPFRETRLSTLSLKKHTPSDEISHGPIDGWTYTTESTETTHFSVVDGEGNAVAVTTTLNGSFGSKVAVRNAGFLLNNEMDDFSVKPGTPNMFGLVGSEANAIAPGKRMLSSMSPTIVTRDSKPVIIAGAAGGPRIITATWLAILNILDYEMNAMEALTFPRFHHQWYPDRLLVEKQTLDPDLHRTLTTMGHEIVESSALARVHLLHIAEDGVIEAAADPRGDGGTAGF